MEVLKDQRRPVKIGVQDLKRGIIVTVRSTVKLTSRLPRSRKVAAIAVIASTAMLLSACNNTVTEAAKVGQTIITNDEVSQSVNEVLASRKGVDTSQMQLQSGTSLVQGQFESYFYSDLFNEIAKLLKLNITNTDLATYKADVLKTIGGEANLPKALIQSNIAPQDFDRTIRQNFILNQLAAIAKANKLTNTNGEAITAWVVSAAQKVGVTINPRYGSFNTQTGGITAPTSNSAVTPSTTSSSAGASTSGGSSTAGGSSTTPTP